MKYDEDVLIVSKDSLGRNLQKLDKWIKDEDVYLVIDEAHHATAKTYRNIINHIRDKGSNLKVLGLTATPFRTDEKEKGLLGTIFTDDIIYETSLNNLINRYLLSKPIFDECTTDISLGDSLGLNALKSIQNFDNIPEDIAEEIANNANRNAIIVDKYIQNKDKFGKTIVFALNRIHAIVLNKLFIDKGVRSEFIIS